MVPHRRGHRHNHADGDYQQVRPPIPQLHFGVLTWGQGGQGGSKASSSALAAEKRKGWKRPFLLVFANCFSLSLVSLLQAVAFVAHFYLIISYRLLRSLRFLSPRPTLASKKLVLLQYP